MSGGKKESWFKDVVEERECGRVGVMIHLDVTSRLGNLYAVETRMVGNFPSCPALYRPMF